jgi:hypothetical protein
MNEYARGEQFVYSWGHSLTANPPARCARPRLGWLRHQQAPLSEGAVMSVGQRTPSTNTATNERTRARRTIRLFVWSFVDGKPAGALRETKSRMFAA